MEKLTPVTGTYAPPCQFRPTAFEVRAAARAAAGILAAAVEPGTHYLLADVARYALHGDLGLARMALSYLGWSLPGVMPETTTPPTPERLAEIDSYILANLLRRDRGDGVISRDLTRACRSGWVTAWHVHGALDRLLAAGKVQQSPPQLTHHLGRRPAPRWHVTQPPTSADTTPVTSVV